MNIFTYIWLSLIILWPIVFNILEHFDPNRGLIWFYLQQLYYWPLGSWLKEPFFQPDSEVGFFVKPLGRIATASIYLLILFGWKVLRKK
ncbi:hypothetical protein NP590_20135 [Methylomonas sp. SURF-2]|uniref:Uncharacterized protein n=1 Tax=Methylomonas subterranea TaxID=2952225 RepID=A0ABT1TM96_9GAMM|nr:hypothetical protein [Methylomonas sp. SURF-2]MCQ8106419.1 hypothetical protein [Methylomonas sp. SURF-2]